MKSPYQSDESTPQVVSAPKRIKIKKMRLLLAILLVAVVAGAAIYSLSRQNVDTQPITTKVSGKESEPRDFSFAPRFTHVSAYVKYKDAEWYATDSSVIRVQEGIEPKIYAHREGLPVGSITNLLVHNDVLWVSSQHGTAILAQDESNFREILVDKVNSKSTQAIKNGKIYQDVDSGKLYLSTFEDFYSFDDAAQAWNTTSGVKPINAQSIVFNKKFALANSNAPGSPVWVFSKKSSQWTLVPVPGMSDQVASVFSLAEELFIMGRSSGYSSCAQAGLAPATVAYRLDESGSWKPMNAFNADKGRPELHVAIHIQDPITTAYTSSCTSTEKPKLFTLSYANGDLALTNERAAPENTGGVLGDDGEQQAVVTKLAKATGLRPMTQGLAVDKFGNLIFGYSDTYSFSSSSIITGLATAKGFDISNSKSINLPKISPWQTIRPILCEGALKYVFIGSTTGMGMPDGWSTTRILEVKGEQTHDFADLGNNLARPDFACAGNSITWLGKDGIRQLNISTKATMQVGPKLGSLSPKNGRAVALSNGDLWVLSAPNLEGSATGTLYYFEKAKSTVTKLATIANANDLMGGSLTNIWVSSGMQSTSGKLSMYGRDGARAYQKSYGLPYGIIAIGDASAVVWYGEPEDNFLTSLTYKVLDPVGTEATINASMPVHSAFKQMDISGTSNYGLYDKKRNRAWTTNMFSGFYAIPLK